MRESFDEPAEEFEKFAGAKEVGQDLLASFSAVCCCTGNLSWG